MARPMISERETDAVRPGERQRRLDEADAALDAELKLRYPEFSLAELRQTHPDEWLAVVPTKVGDAGWLVACRVVAYAPDHASLQTKLRALESAYPRIRFHDLFTGSYGTPAAGKTIVRV